MIDVLLAIYRPKADWLKAQIDSIRAQRGVEANLICREDTVGEGACVNFAALLQESAAEYVAFADQDDVWLPDKLAKCMSKMHELERQWGVDTPLLVFSDARVVDADLKPLSDSLFRRIRVNPLRNRPRQLVFQNTAYGNTMMINAALRDLAKPIPSKAFMHDSWMMLVASVFGKVAYLDEPLLLYRQHEDNVVGGDRVGIGYFFRAIARGRVQLRVRQYANIRQVEAFVNRFGYKSPEVFRALVGFTDRPYIQRIGILLRHRILKSGIVRNLGLWAVI